MLFELSIENDCPRILWAPAVSGLPQVLQGNFPKFEIEFRSHICHVPKQITQLFRNTLPE